MISTTVEGGIVMAKALREPQALAAPDPAAALLHQAPVRARGMMPHRRSFSAPAPRTGTSSAAPPRRCRPAPTCPAGSSAAPAASRSTSRWRSPRCGRPVALLAAIGRDRRRRRARRRPRRRRHRRPGLHRHDGPTDAYLAIEGPGGELHAAVADCAGLERAGAALLAPLADGRLPAPGPARSSSTATCPRRSLAALLAIPPPPARSRSSARAPRKAAALRRSSAPAR